MAMTELAILDENYKRISKTYITDLTFDVTSNGFHAGLDEPFVFEIPHKHAGSIASYIDMEGYPVKVAKPFAVSRWGGEFYLTSITVEFGK